MAIDLGKECVNKIALAYLAIILAPLNISADIIFFKDGMKTGFVDFVEILPRNVYKVIKAQYEATN